MAVAAGHDQLCCRGEPQQPCCGPFMDSRLPDAHTWVLGDEIGEFAGKSALIRKVIDVESRIPVE